MTDDAPMFRVVEDVYVAKYGPSYEGPPGGIASRGMCDYRHRFGGESWTVADPNPQFGGPVLVLTLDLRDPLLTRMRTEELDEIPLCSYLGCDIWGYPQLYRVYPQDRRVVFVARKEPATESLFPEFGGVMVESPVCIEPMASADYPTTEDAYWSATDCFVGGSRFIRVLGPPLWLYAVATVTCKCGREMTYVCGIGYESQSLKKPHSGLVPHEPLFFGEAATYWFLCPHCLLVCVITQST